MKGYDSRNKGPPIQLSFTSNIEQPTLKSDSHGQSCEDQGNHFEEGMGNVVKIAKSTIKEGQ
jgi:hypothetical protein